MPIRPATSADIPALVALANDTPTAAQWSELQYWELFAGTPRLVQVIDDAAAIRGFLVAQTSTPDWELENIVVAPTHQRRGLATLLLNALIGHARQSNAACIFLEVRASNLAARAFYEHHHFRETGRRPNYYTNPTEDAILYRLEISW